MQEKNKDLSIAQMTSLQYLELEKQSSVRHEYIAGQVFAMTGSSKRHNIITLNIASAIHSHLIRGSACRVFVNDLKVQVKQNNSFYYPDILIDCAAHDGNAVYTDSPSLIIEVLSRSTWMIDKREKMLAYRSLYSLKEYLIVHQSKRKIELHRRNKKGQWEFKELATDLSESLHLESVPNGPFRLSFAEIYADVEMSQADTDDGNVCEELQDYILYSNDVSSAGAENSD